MEPCYLAYMVFESKTLSSSSRQLQQQHQHQQQRRTNSSAINTTSLKDSHVAFDDTLHLIKYFDSLSHIPTSRELKKCDMIKRNRNNIINKRLLK